MRKQKLFDPKLNVKEYAHKIGKLLRGVELSTMEGYTETMRVETTAWYNGRERGLALTLTTFTPERPTFVIAFGEHRISDAIFIDCFTMKMAPFNAPTHEDMPDYAYKNTRIYVNCNDSMFSQAAAVIQILVAAWVKGLIPFGFGREEEHTPKLNVLPKAIAACKQLD